MGAISDSLLRLALGQLQWVAESTFNTDPGSGYAYVEHLGAIDVSGLRRPHVPHEAQRGAVDDHHKDIYAPVGVVADGANFSTRHYLSGFSATVPADTAAVTAKAAFPLAKFCQALLGGLDQGVVATFDSGSTAVALELVDATGIVAGDVLAADTESGDGETWDAAVVKAVSSNTVTLREALLAAPAASTKCHGGFTCFTEDTLTESITFFWQGWLEDSTTPLALKISGCVPESAEFSFVPGEIPTVTITWRIGSATWDDAAATGCDYAAWAYARPEYQIQGNVGFYDQSTGALESGQPVISSVTVKVANDLQSFPTPTAVGRIYTHKLGARKVTIDVRGSYVADALLGEDGQSFKFVHGTEPGKMVIIEAPSVYKEDLAGPSDEKGYAFADYTLRVLRYAGDTAGASDHANRLLYIGFN